MVAGRVLNEGKGIKSTCISHAELKLNYMRHMYINNLKVEGNCLGEER